MYPDKFVKKPSDIPVEEHFALFVADTYTSEDYGQSSSNPFISYEAYLTKEKLIEAITENDSRTYSKKEFKVCRVIPMKVEKTVNVVVK